MHQTRDDQRGLAAGQQQTGRTATRREVIATAAAWPLIHQQKLPPIEGQPGLISRGFLYETASFPSCHASSIVETTSGFAAAYFGGTDEGEPDVAIWVSLHRGGKWGPPTKVADGKPDSGTQLPCWNPVLFTLRDGRTALYYKIGPNPRDWWGMKMHSSDGGETWSKPERLHDGILGPIRAKPIRLRNGDILSGSSIEYDGWKVHMERSSDQGATWDKTPALNDGKEFSAIQPTLIPWPGGRIQALCRTRQKVISQLWSENEGKTWSKMTTAYLPNPSAGIDAVLLRDGRALLIYNPVDKGRTPLELAASKDGKTWRKALTLENESGEFSYPAIIQARDGKVHITYTWNRKRIRHAVVDPAKLRRDGAL